MNPSSDPAPPDEGLDKQKEYEAEIYFVPEFKPSPIPPPPPKQ